MMGLASNRLSPPSANRTKGMAVGNGNPATEWAHATLLTASSTAAFDDLVLAEYKARWTSFTGKA